jgi:hypothetical protein
MPTLTLSYTGTTTSITREYNRLIAFVSGPPGAPGPSGANGLDGTGVFSFSGYLTTGQADLRYYPLDSNPSGYINTFEFTGLSGYLDNLIQNSSNGVSSLNGLTGILNIVGTGNVFITLNGSNIIISGSGSNASVDFSGYITTGDADARYYSINNPSGFITGVDTGYLTGYLPRSETGQFASQTNLGLTGTALLNSIEQTGNSLQTQINLINANTGNFYLNSNPSGYITGVDTGYLTGYLPRSETGQLVSNLATQTQLTLTGQTLSNQIGAITGTTGLFYLRSNPSGFITNFELTGASGDLQIQITNLNGVTGSFYLSSNPSGYITNFALTGASGVLQDYINIINNTTGIFITTGQTGEFALQNTLTGLSGYLISLIGASSAGVSSLNGLSGVLNIQGAGNVFVTNVGQNIIISGSGSQANVDLSGYITTGQADLRYYPLGSNPSGYLINFNLTGASGALQQQITNINNNTGQFYLNSNPSGYITGFSSGDYITTGQTGQFASYVLVTGLSGQLVNDLATKVQLTLTGQTLFNQISQITGATGLFYLNSNPSGFITNVNLTGASGALQIQITNVNNITGSFYLNTNPSGFITNFNLTGASGALQTAINLINSTTGIFITTGQTGQFASQAVLNNFSGYIISLIDAASAGVSSLNGASGTITLVGAGNVFVTTVGQTITISGSGIQQNLSGYITTGDADSRYYPLGSNPSGYLTNFNLTGASGSLQSQINVINNTTGIFINTGQTGQFASYTLVTGLSGQLTNDFATKVQLTLTGQTLLAQIGELTGATGLFYLRSNPSGFITNFNLTGASGALQVQVNTLNGVTGSFYLSSNPSGYIRNFELTGASGVLQSAINAINSVTGIFITTGQTGQFASQVTLTGLSGYLINLIGASSAGVSALNGASGVITLAGAGNVFVTTAGQTITISGSGTQPNLSGYITTGTADTRYYPLGSNPSGYLTNLSGVSLALVTGLSGQIVIDFATKAQLTTTGQTLSNRIDTITGVTGLFYLNSNPSGFITNFNLTGASGALQSQITNVSTSVTSLSGFTVNISGYLQNIINGSAAFSGNSQFESRVEVIPASVNRHSVVFSQPFNLVPIVVGNIIYTGSDFIIPNIKSVSNTGFELTFSESTLLNQYRFNFLALSGNLYNISGGFAGLAGVISLNSATGAITLAQAGNVFVTVNGQTITISGSGSSAGSNFDPSGYITTGQADLRYYPLGSNPSGYLTNLSGLSFALVTGLSGQAVIDYATKTQLTLTGQTLLGQIAQITGVTGLFYLNSNTSGFITNFNLTGASGALQGQITTINNTTGNYYPRSTNPSGYLRNFDLTGQGLYLSTSEIYAFGVLSIHWLNRELYDQNGTGSIDWHGRVLEDDDEKVALLWGSEANGGRRLISDLDEITLDWNNRILSGNWKLYNSPIINLTGLQSYSGQIVNYVNSISGAVKLLTATGISISGNVGISGIGGTQVFIVGNSIIISGSAGGGAGDVTFAQLTGASGALQTQINSISSSGSASVPFNLYLAKISMSIDAGTNTIETGFKGYFEATSDMTISGWNIVANRTGTILIDLFKTTYNNFSSFGSIITGIPPSLNNQNKSYGNIMTGWNIGVSRGDILEFVVKGCTGINKININITGTKNE